MKRRAFRISVCVLCALLLTGTSPLLAYANSAQSWFEGVDGNGVIMTDTESPIVVEKEVLTLDIQELPKSYYQDAEEYLAYSAKVTAEYTFYNPSDYTVTAKLLFPFGSVPNYAVDYIDDAGNDQLLDDVDKYEITVDGVPVERKIRHTLSNDMLGFEVEKDLPLVQDDFVEDDFYSPELMVTKYTFEVSGVQKNKYPAARVATDIPKGLGERRFCLANNLGSHIQKDGDLRISTSVNRYSNVPFELYVFGTPLVTLPQWQVYERGGVKDGEEISGEVELIDTQTMTFQAFALERRSEESSVSECDWYNAVVYSLNESQKNNSEYPIVYDHRDEYRFDRQLMRWYEYEIALAPKTRIVNAVAAPMYPAINLRYEPDIYEYTYLLSPAKTWKSFGELEIVIHTPYYITESSLEGLQIIEGGYTVLLDGLPEGELTFTLCTSATPERESSPYTAAFGILIVISIALPLFLVGIVIAVVIEIVSIRKNKSKKRKTR